MHAQAGIGGNMNRILIVLSTAALVSNYALAEFETPEQIGFHLRARLDAATLGSRVERLEIAEQMAGQADNYHYLAGEDRIRYVKLIDELLDQPGTRDQIQALHALQSLGEGEVVKALVMRKVIDRARKLLAGEFSKLRGPSQPNTELMGAILSTLRAIDPQRSYY